MENAKGFSYDNVLQYIDGILYYKDIPQVFVKLALQHGKRWVFVYDINKGDYKRYGTIRKDYEKIPKARLYDIDDASTIGADYKEELQKNFKNEFVLKEKSYIYQVPVVGGVSSISKKEGDGFYERIRKQTGKEYTYTPSGVFISLDDVTWDNENYKMDVDSLLKEGKRSVQEEQIRLSGKQQKDYSGVYF